MFFNYIKSAFIRKNISLYIFSFAIIFGQNSTDMAMKFDQGQYARIPISESLYNFNQFTLECWYYETGFSGGDERIVGTETANSNSGIYLNRYSNSWSYGLGDENGTFIGNGNIGNVPVNEWIHVAVTYDGSTIRLFANGQLVHSQDGVLSNIGNPNSDLVINRHTWNGGSSSRLSGYLDELRISSIARYTSNFEVPQNEFNVDEFTAGLWHFNGDLDDISGNDNHIILSGASLSDFTPDLGEPIVEDDSDYAVGGVGPAGGFVIYDKGSVSDGWRYIEIAPDDWNGNGDPTTTWGCSGSEIDGADGYELGSGMQNSIDIANDCDGDNAASISLNTEINGYNDWHLPSIDELWLMYQLFVSDNIGNYQNHYYWSSTEFSSIGALFINFGSNEVQYQNIGDTNKQTYTEHFRPIRYFSGQEQNEDDENYSVHFDFMSGYSESLTSSTNIFGGIQPFTVEAWYKNEGVNTGPNAGYDDGANIVSSYRRSGGGDPYGNFNFGIHTGDSENSGKGYADHGVKTNERIDDGAWHHLAATYEPNSDGSWSFRLYLDGVLNDQNTGPSEGYDHTSSNNNIRMNNHSPFAGDHMLDCSYAGMAITSGLKYIENFSPQFPLSPNENTIVNLDFSDGDGNQLIDNSGNGNHFNLYGNYQWGSDVPTEPVYGCTDIYADNYDSDATADDGSCNGYPDEGNYYLSFDGVDDYLHIDNYEGSFSTFSFLTKVNINSQSNPYSTIFSFGIEAGGNNSHTRSIDLGINQDHGLRVNLNYDYGFASTGNYPVDEWVDIAGVFDNGQLSLYLNGEVVSAVQSNINSIVFENSDPNNFIGAAFTYGQQSIVNFFNGSIDYLSFFDIALNADQVNQYAQSNLVGNEDGLISLWNMNSADDIIYDYSGGQSHGDINGATWNLPVMPGENNSLSFDGDDDRVELPNQITEGLTSVTFMAWFNTTDHSGYSDIVQQDATSGALFIRYDPDGSFKYVFKAGQGWRSISISPPSYGVWHHVAMSWDGNNIIAYLDGEEVGSSNGSGIISGGGPIYIGNWQQAEGFSGKIDDVQYWDIALSESEIQMHMNTERTGNEEGLIGYWNFNRGEGSELIDLSGNGNNGTIYGATWSGDGAPIEPPSYGCTDIYADNYDSDATTDDGSCAGYPDNGDHSLIFDGVDDFIEIDNNSIFTNSGDLTNNFTINLSFKKYNNPQDFEGVNLFSAGDGTVNGKRLSVFINNDNTIIVPLEGNDWITDHVISENIWTDLSLTYLNGIMKLYINGVLVDETNQYTVSIDTSSPLRIGSNTMSRGDEFFHGHIDNVVIWNRYLSESEIEYFTFGFDSLLSFDGIVASYSFNSGSGDIVYDRSGGQSHGDISGAAWNLLATPGENNSLSFDGINDRVVIPHNPEYDFNDQFTIQGWFNHKSDMNERYIITKGRDIPPASSHRFWGLRSNNDGSLFFEIIMQNSGYNGFQIDPSFPLNTWNHFSLVYDGSSLKFYLNGVESWSNPLSGNLQNGTYDLSIGYFPHTDLNTYGYFFEGGIDDISLWDVALSADQIQPFLDSELSGQEQGLVGYWNFNEGEGLILSDLRGENNGIINGATWSGDSAPIQPPIPGCIDNLAENYNAYAGLDDGSCYYPEVDNFSLSFNGEVNSVDIDVSISGDYTVSGWFNYETADVGNAIVGSSSNDYIRIVPDLNDGSQRFLGYNSPTGANHKGQIALEANRWHHFAVTRSGDELSFFINGEFDGSFYEPSSDLDWVKIGIYRNGWQHGFHGGIDDITIWDSHIEQSQIKEIMNIDSLWSKNENAMLKANYRFNAGEGNILFDHSGNASHGIINGATWGDGFISPPVSVTFLVNMRDYEGMELENGEIYDGDLSEGLFLAGGNIGHMANSDDDQTGFQMSDDDGDLVYEVTLDLESNSFYWYKFRIGLTDGNWQGNWESISDCGYGDYNDRYFSTTYESNQTVGPYCFSSCENCEIPNMSLSFDGQDDYVLIQNPGPIGNSERSIQFKAKQNILEDINGLFYYGQGGPNNQNKLISVAFDNSGLYIDITRAWVKFEGIQIDNSFHNYTLVFGSSGMLNDAVLYQDGIKHTVSSSGLAINASYNINTNPGSLFLGKTWHISNDYPSDYFNGLIDEFMIWDFALNEEQVQSFLINPPSSDEQGIVSYWNFNEGEGNTLTDLSGNGNDGTIFGASWSDDVPQPLHLGPNWFVSIGEGSDENNGSEDYPFSSIQRAINAANENDSIYVSTGTYFENLFISEKNITLRSADGPESTIIDGNGNNRVVHMNFSGSDSINGHTTIDGFTIKNGVWDASGAGINVYYGHLELRNSIIEDNESTADVGGGVSVEYGNLHINGSIIRGNKSKSGGGLAAREESQVFIGESVIEHNEVIQQGGGVFATGSSSLYFINTNILFNSTAQDCFTGQGSQGAGLFLKNSFINYQNGSISDNYAADTGGAFFLSDGSSGQFNQTLYSKNKGAEVGGGVNTTGSAIGAVFDSNIDFTQCTFADNVSLSGGVSGFFGANATININNSIIWNNSGEWQGSTGQMLGPADYNINYSNIEGGFNGDDNFDDNPQFCNPLVGDYQLSENSSSLGDSSFVGAFSEPGCESAYINYALSFNGNDDQVELDPSFLNGLSEFTFQAMFYANQEQSGISNIIQHDGPDHDFYLRYENGFFTAVQKHSGSEYGVIDIDSPEPGVWHQITFTYDGSNSKFYLNGEEKGSFDLTGQYIANETIYLGNWDQREGFDGQIDEVSIFNYALTQDEISEYYGRALSGFESGLISHFNFNEGSGSTLNDITGNGNDGIIIGATWGVGAPLGAPIVPSPEMLAINVEIIGNNVSFSFEADTLGLGYYDFVWELNDYGQVMSYESNSAQDLRPGLHYVRAALVDQFGQISSDHILQSFYVLDGIEQYYYTGFEDTVATGLPNGWSSFSNGQGWYVSDNPYFEWWTAEPGVGNVLISNDDAANNNGSDQDYNDGSQDYLNLPPMDFTSFGGPVALEFGSFFTGEWYQTAHVTYSNDGGNNWYLLADVDSSDRWERQYFDLSFLQNFDNVVLGFHSNDNGHWASGWIIDDVSIVEAYSLQTTNISGHVFSSNDGMPLSDALVIAVEENNYFDHQVFSDGNGYFSLDVISGANYYLSASKSDYQNNVQYISISDSSIYLDIYLDDLQEIQDAVVEGNVYNWYTNELLENASVLFAYDQEEMQTIEVSTDDNGYFMVQVPGEKDYDLFIYADGYWVEHDAFYLNEGEHQVLSIGIAGMSTASRLYGTIRDAETNDLIPYAEVYLNCEEASDWDRTGNIGTYRLFNYYPGDCANGVFMANANGYETYVQSVSDVEFEAGVSINRDIMLSQGNDPEPGFLSGRVISNVNGIEIHGALISAFSVNTGQVFEATTDSGNFVFSLPESEYALSISAEGHQERFISLYVQSGSQVDTTIYLDEIYSNLIYGSVSSSSGQQISDVIVDAKFEINNIEMHQSTITNDNGFYQLTVPNGSFDLSASLTGYQISWVYDISMSDSDTEINFTLEQIESFDGALMGSVYFFGNLFGTATINVFNDNYSAETVTAENGTFHLDLINGTYSIFAVSNGYSSIMIPDAIVIADNIVNYDIHFSQPGFVEPPIISSLVDVPDDQGRHLDMTWLSGDAQDFGNFTQYSIWRKITNLPNSSPELWHYIASENFIENTDSYDQVVPTLIDATADTIHYSTFMVTAHTDDPYVFFDSPPYSGFSVDNLSPEVPENLSISNSTIDDEIYNVELSWSNPVDEDFAYHNVYRNDINSEDGAFIFQTIESSFIDVVYEWGNFEYWVTAVDHNGNESNASEVAGVELSVKQEIIPEEFALHQNYPNPFNPSTQIGYALPENSNVTIVIYNMLGSKVRTLINEAQDPGFRNVLWNATNDKGVPVSAGMYIYTIQAGNFYQAKKMILLK